MNYTSPFTDFFKIPDWGKTLVLAALCMFIPVVGSMVLMGWLFSGFWRADYRRPESFPLFDFDRFLPNLKKGLWPTLVSLVASLPASMILWIPMMFLLFTMFSDLNIIVKLLGVLILLAVTVAVLVAIGLVAKPLVLRAALLQDFGKAFDFGFVKKYLSLVWKEVVISTAVTLGAYFILAILLYPLICIGTLFTLAVGPIFTFAWVHLERQLYDLYISRGGEPLEVSPLLLSDNPPAPPVIPA